MSSPTLVDATACKELFHANCKIHNIMIKTMTNETAARMPYNRGLFCLILLFKVRFCNSLESSVSDNKFSIIIIYNNGKEKFIFNFLINFLYINKNHLILFINFNYNFINFNYNCKLFYYLHK